MCHPCHGCDPIGDGGCLFVWSMLELARVELCGWPGKSSFKSQLEWNRNSIQWADMMVEMEGGKSDLSREWRDIGELSRMSLCCK